MRVYARPNTILMLTRKICQQHKKQWFGFHISNYNLLKRGRVPMMPIETCYCMKSAYCGGEILGLNIVCGCLPTAFVYIYAVPSFKELTG